jgi:NADH-quinone oxidoreductase subunit M
MNSFPYLTVLLLIPIGAAAALLFVPGKYKKLIHIVSVVTSVAVFGFSALILDEFKSGVAGYQMTTVHSWFGSLGIQYSLGIDGISLFLVLMTTLLFPIALAGANEKKNTKSFVIWTLLLEAACLGSFLATDLLLFFIFFEATLVPVYFLIVQFGYERRGYAAVKFFVYTFLGSAFLLVGILALAFIHQSQTHVLTFNVTQLANTHLDSMAEVLLFLAFTAAFAVKAPIFPFHSWSPDAYSESPTSGSILLAGVMAKLGSYGVIRFDLGLFPHAVVMLAPLFLTLGAIGIIYGGIVAAKQKNLKRLVAYSSLAHLGFIIMGAFALSNESVSGAVLQMLNHGIYTAALFLLIAMIYRRRGTHLLSGMSGMQKSAPILAAVFILMVMASIGVPGLNGFVGEFLILAGTFITHRWWAVVGVLGVVVAAVYLLWAYQQVFHGPEKGDHIESEPKDLTMKEGMVLAPLVILVILLGVYPKPFLDRITPSVDKLITHVEQKSHVNLPIPAQPTALSVKAFPLVSIGQRVQSITELSGPRPSLLSTGINNSGGDTKSCRNYMWSPPAHQVSLPSISCQVGIS